ncbi:MAG TPA: DNA polymerase III subunit gamma/tau, partial [Verrucomicrobiae bacterium]
QLSLSNTDSLTRILEVFADAELRLRDAASKKILLEVSLLRAIEARNSLPLDAVLKQLNQLRGQTGGTTAAPAQPAPSAPPAKPVAAPANSFAALREVTAPPAPTSKPPVLPPAAPVVAVAAAPVAGSSNLTELWHQLVEAVGRVSMFTRGYLIDAHPVAFEKGIFTIGFDPEFMDHLSLVDNARNHTLIATKLAELGHPNSMIRFVKSEAPTNWERKALSVLPTTPAAAPAAKPAPAATSAKSAEPAVAPVTEKRPTAVVFNKEEFKNDPLIQKALEIFKGTIVEVRA